MFITPEHHNSVDTDLFKCPRETSNLNNSTVDVIPSEFTLRFGYIIPNVSSCANPTLTVFETFTTFFQFYHLDHPKPKLVCLKMLVNIWNINTISGVNHL